MNLLTDPLPDSVEIRGKRYPVRADFRTGIRLEQLLLDPDRPDRERILLGLGLCYGERLPPLEEGALAMRDFYFHSRDRPGQKEGGAASKGEIYDFTLDSEYIYAGFRSAYGIDLCRAELHWYEFLALFRSLPEDCLFSKIIQYRSMEIPSSLPKEQKEFYRRMKRIYALPRRVSKTKRQKLDQISQALMGGGDLSGFFHEYGQEENGGQP